MTEQNKNVIRFSALQDPTKWEDNSFACLNEEEAKKAEKLITTELTRLREIEVAARELVKMSKNLIGYCEDHDWGYIPEPYDSLNFLLKAITRAESLLDPQRKKGQL